MAKTIREFKVTEERVVAINCDKCKLTYNDPLDIQEFISIEQTGGYASAWGDGNKISLDFCSDCSLEIFNSYVEKG